MADERINVLHIVHRLNRAGTQLQATALAKHHGPKFQASVISLFSGGSLEKELVEAGVPVDVLGLPARRPVRFWPQIGSILRQRQPHVVHTHTPECARYAIPPAAIQKVPVRVVKAGMTHAQWSWRTRAFERFVAGCATYMVGNCDAVRRFYVERLHYKEEKTKVIPNGIELPQFQLDYDRTQIRSELGVSPTAAVISSIGSLSRRKDHASLVRSLPRIVKEVPHAVLLIAGDGPERHQLLALARECGVAHALKLLGIRDDVPRLLAATDLFVMSSRQEGRPNVIVEASAAGVPSVATDVDGIPEIVLDGQTGLLVPPGDSEAIAESVVRLLKDESLRKDMGQSALAQAQRYDINRAVENVEALYLSALTADSLSLSESR